MSVIGYERIRLALDVSVKTSLVDVLTGSAPSFCRGSDVAIEVAFFTNGVLADVSNLASATLSINQGQTPPGNTLDSVTTGSFNNSLTLEQWQSGEPEQYHCLFILTNSQTNINTIGLAGKLLWMVTSLLTTDSPAHQIPLGYGPMTLIESGAFTTPPSVVATPLYYTAAQSDARYTIVNGKVAKAGDTMTGPLQFSGAGFLVLANVTTAQRNALSVFNGSVIFNTDDQGIEYYYTGSGWQGLVNSVNGITGASITLTTANVSENTNLYFTSTRVLNQVLTGFTAGAGTVTAADSVLTALQKVAANSGGGTVTSVALTMPGFFSVANSPITNSGTLAVTMATGQTQNQVLATPNGSSGAVSLRSLVAADIPNIAEGQVTNLTSDLTARALLAGATFTGAVMLPAGTPTGLQAVQVTYLSSAYLALAGGTMTGVLNTVDVSVNAANSISWATAPTTSNHLVNKTYADTKASLAGATFTGAIGFSGTGFAGMTLNNLTSTQISALSAATGMTVYNSTLSNIQYFNGTSWASLASGATAALHISTGGAPSNSIGNNGDFAFDSVSGIIYFKATGAWAVFLEAPAYLQGATFTGDLNFTGTSHAGLVFNNLTTTQMNALTPLPGAVIFNTTANQPYYYTGSAWATLVGSGSYLPLSGGTLTGALIFSALLNPAINFGNGWTINAVDASDMSWSQSSTQGLLLTKVSPTQVDVLVENGVLWVYQGIKDSSARQILNNRITGWGAASNGSRAAFNGSGATLAQTSAALAQLIADCTTQGFIGP